MKHISEILKPMQKEIADQCLRITGKTLEEWEAVYLRRRRRDLGGLNLTGSRLFTDDEVSYALMYYGLDEDDFERVIVKLGHDVDVPPNFPKKMKVVSATPTQLTEIEEHELRRTNVVMRDGMLTGRNRRDHDTPVRSVVRHRIIQDALQRIAVE